MGWSSAGVGIRRQYSGPPGATGPIGATECENVAVSNQRVKVVVSACLLGAPVRYNGTDKKSTHPILQRWVDEGRTVSVCPEVLGGLGTPRPPAEIVTIGGTRRVHTDG